MAGKSIKFLEKSPVKLNFTKKLMAPFTVVGATSTIADGWSTALTVLGPDGFKRLPPGVQAMLIAGTEQDPQVTRTVGSEKLATGLLVAIPPVPVPRKGDCAHQKRPNSRAYGSEARCSSIVALMGFLLTEEPSRTLSWVSMK
jgi:hypothetical protein